MRNLLWIVVIALVFVLSWYVGGMLQQQDEKAIQPMTHLPCQPVGSVCEAGFSDATLQIEFISPVVVMLPFTARVNTKANISEMYLQFRMKNMDMGEQRYRLLNKGNGLWESGIVLPVCSLARSDWIAVLEVEYQKIWWRGEFEFTVAKQL